MAVQSRGSVNVFVHPPKLSLEAMATPARISRWDLPVPESPIRQSDFPFPHSSAPSRAQTIFGGWQRNSWDKSLGI